MKLRSKIFLSLMLALAVGLQADDGAASLAEGGLVVMKREPRITMAKEILQISATRVRVDYDFRNDSDQDITTEVTFPIPDYGFDWDDQGIGFDDFQLWINGAATHYQTEARAFLKDKEYTQLLTSLHIDIPTFAHAEVGKVPEEIKRLTAAQHKQLEDAGFLDMDRAELPLWKVRKKYYWEQTFPAHKIVQIRHEYTPVRGNKNSISYGMGRSQPSMRPKKSTAFVSMAGCMKCCNRLRMARSQAKGLPTVMWTSY